MKILVFLMSSLLSHQVIANELYTQSPDELTLEMMAKHNQELAEQENNVENFSFDPVGAPYDIWERQTKVVPFAEYEQTGYVFFNDDDYRGYATVIKQTIAKTLPKDVTLVVYSTSRNDSYLKDLKNKYLQFIEHSRLIVLQVPRSGSNDFWTRDNLPLPVWTDGEFTLVDAKYYYNFEPDEFMSELFGSVLTSHNYFFEGGNFMTNSRGECIVVNRKRSYIGGTSDTAAIPDSIFKNHYGCKKLTRFKHLKGIGHADEVVKFLSDDVIVTDTPEYVGTLENLGYQVHLLPEPDRAYETYVNSLQVNNVLYVPKFNENGDSKAVDIYQKLNPDLKIIALPTRRLATGGQGGIHCITMNYPKVPLAELVNLTGGTIIQ